MAYLRPGVHIEEIAKFPPSVAPVATAVPVFIGYTASAENAEGEDLSQQAVRISSMIEYEALYGGPVEQRLEAIVGMDDQLASIRFEDSAGEISGSGKKG